MTSTGLLLALSLSFAAPTTSTTSTTPLLLATVLRQADLLHPTVVAASADVDSASADLLAAEGIFDPTLRARGDVEGGNYLAGTADAAADVLTPLWGTRVEGGWRMGVGDFPIYDGKKKTNDFGEFRLGVSVPLLRDGAIDSRRATLAKLRIEQQARQEALRQTRLEVARVAASAYYDWVGAGARLAIDENLLELALTREGQLRRRADAGDVPAFEVQDNSRLIASRQGRVITARRALERTALTLALYLRDDDGVPRAPTRPQLPSSSSLSPLSPAPTRDALLTQALQQRPEARRGQLVLEQLAVDDDAATNQLLPGLSLTAAISQDVGGTSAPLSSSSSVWNPDPKTRGLPDGKVGLSFDLPIPQRAARGRAALVNAARDRARALLQLVNDRIALEVDDVTQAWQAADERGVTTAAEVEAGDSTLLLVNLREVAAAEARVAAADAAIDRARADVALALVTGRLLDD